MSLTFISAGAGSGKTHTLMQTLSQRLSEGTVRPSGVIATTFTVRAATELRERVRQHLLAEDMFGLANAMGQARIGTVNGVCGALLERFAFEAGMATQQRVLDEGQSDQLIREALDASTPPHAVSLVSSLATRLGIEDWTKDLKALVGQARSNDIGAHLLPGFADQNAQDLLGHFPRELREGLSQDVLTEISRMLPGFSAAAQASKAKKTRDFLTELEALQNGLSTGRLPWSKWVTLANIAPEKALVPQVESLQMLLKAVDAHPQLHADIRDYLRQMFAICAASLDHYRERKLSMGVVDFVDQEQLLLKVLDNPEVADDVRDELDLLMVDEFQDTSPIQLALFLKLSKLAKHTYWVGDLKQAIYGFRGSDTALMQSVLAALPQLGGTKEILGESWRSTPDLVHWVNDVFTATFADTLGANEVALTPRRPQPAPEAAAPVLADWVLEGKNVAQTGAALALAVQDLLGAGRQVPSKGSERLRALEARDIAILCATNIHVDQTADSLIKAGIPVATAQAGLLATPEATLALACLRRLNDPTDTVATAEIISMADGCEAPEWLTDRLTFLAEAAHDRGQWRETGPDAHALVAKIAELRAQLPVLTPREALRRVITSCRVPELALRWKHDPRVARRRLANLEALLGAAAQYEDECGNGGDAATISGLLLWLSQQAKAQNDPLALPDVDAVQVMTHHGSKGLEWPIVIVMGLESTVRSRLWGISSVTDGEVDALHPLANRRIRYWPWPFGQKSTGIAVADVIAESQVAQAFDAAAVAETRRLLYVCMTRPRECLILVKKAKTSAYPYLDCLGSELLSDGAVGTHGLTLSSGHVVRKDTISYQAEEPAAEPGPALEGEPLHWFVNSPVTERLPLHVQPSKRGMASASIAEIVPIGDGLTVGDGVDWALLGSAVHACLALSFTDPGAKLDNAKLSGLLQGFGVAAHVSADRVGAQIALFHNWIRNRWPASRWVAESPVSAPMSNGQFINGRIDLYVETDTAIVLFDHKITPKANDHWPALLEKYSPQLQTYCDAIRLASPKSVAEVWLFLPVSGVCLRVSMPIDTDLPAGLARDRA